MDVFGLFWHQILGWFLFILYLLLDILKVWEKLALEFSKRWRPLGPYKWADKEIPKSLEEEEKWFFFITGDMDFLDEPWGMDFRSDIVRKKGRMRHKLKILISGTSDEAKNRFEEFKSMGFTEGKDLFRYDISGGLQAAALNERKCVIKVYSKIICGKKVRLDQSVIEKLRSAMENKSYKEIKEIATKIDSKFAKKVRKKFDDRFNIYWNPHERRFFIKRAIVKEYSGPENIDIKKLIEGYFGGALAAGGEEVKK